MPLDTPAPHPASRWRDLSPSAALAGLMAVLVSYAGPLLIVLQAAQAARLEAAQLHSWIWAISIGAGLACLVLSWRFRAPVICAWSTPGAALLLGALPGTPYADAVGAYLAAGAVILVLGWSGAFDRLLGRLPQAVAAALLAGILFRFGTEAFGAARQQAALVGLMFGAFLVLRRALPRYAMALVLVLGLAVVTLRGDLHWQTLSLQWVHPQWTTPHFEPAALLNLGLPLCLLTLTGQFVPGMAVLRTHGYATPAGPLVGLNGLLSVLLAPFGAHGINLAAITAAICSGPEAHEDPRRRYMAGVVCGLAYILVGLFGATLAALFLAMPTALITTLAGLALLGALQSALTQAMAEPGQREAALLCFVVTASGISLGGLGAAFWGLVLGLLCQGLQSVRLARPGTPARA